MIAIFSCTAIDHIGFNTSFCKPDPVYTDTIASVHVREWVRGSVIVLEQVIACMGG